MYGSLNWACSARKGKGTRYFEQHPSHMVHWTPIDSNPLTRPLF